MIDNDIVSDVAFEGSGCAISTAAASLMTQSIKGKSIAEAEALFKNFRRLVMGEAVASDNGPALGKLEALGGVRRFPARVKCATLVWHTLKAALDRQSQMVTTE